MERCKRKVGRRLNSNYLENRLVWSLTIGWKRSETSRKWQDQATGLSSTVGWSPLGVSFSFELLLLSSDPWAPLAPCMHSTLWRPAPCTAPHWSTQCQWSPKPLLCTGKYCKAVWWSSWIMCASGCHRVFCELCLVRSSKAPLVHLGSCHWVLR